MLPPRLIFIYLFGNTLLWSIGFALGLIFGFSIPILGDMLAVIIVGFFVLSLQAYVLPVAISQGSWILITVIGLVVGTALSFFVILIINRRGIASLKNSHIIGFPVILLGIVLFQGGLLFQEYNSTVAILWTILSVVGLLVGMLIIYFISKFQNLELELLAVREKNYASTKNWALMGGVIGLCYASLTLFVLNGI